MVVSYVYKFNFNNTYYSKVELERFKNSYLCVIAHVTNTGIESDQIHTYLVTYRLVLQRCKENR
jgi:hypothetical protein